MYLQVANDVLFCGERHKSTWISANKALHELISSVLNTSIITILPQLAAQIGALSVYKYNFLYKYSGMCM